LDQATYLRAKGLWDGDGQPIVSQRMMSSQSEMVLFNNIVLELSREIEDAKYPQHAGIYKEAKRISEMSKNRDQHGEPKRLKETQKFWKKHGKPLSRALNMSMQPDSDYSQTDTIIKRKK
jgi:hypothetical protein